MGSLIKPQGVQARGPEFSHQDPQKKTGMVGYTCDPNTGKVGHPRAHCSSSLAKQMSSRFSEGKRARKGVKEDAQMMERKVPTSRLDHV